MSSSPSPTSSSARSETTPDPALGGYDPQSGLRTDAHSRPSKIPVPSLLRSLLSQHLDPGYAAAAEGEHVRSRPGITRFWQGMAVVLIATVFAVAVAQAQIIAPGVTSARQVLAASVLSSEDTITQLRTQSDTLLAQLNTVRRDQLNTNDTGRQLLAELDRLSLTTATTAVSGPGLSIVLSDPHRSDLTDAAQQRVQHTSRSAQVILDRDLQWVVNALWASGAEAISINEIRIGPRVTIRQAGGAILVDNHPVSSPYTIAAIGPPTTMMDAFQSSSALYRMRLLQVSYGVHVSVSHTPHQFIPGGQPRSSLFATHN